MSAGDRKDEIFGALASERRRAALSCLSKHDDMTLPDLADELAQIEQDATIDSISAEYVKELYLDLYHRHLPYLTAADLVDYSQAQDRIVITDLGKSVETRFLDTRLSL